MKILSLDQATACGWAVVEASGTVLASGVWQLADRKRTGESRGMRYLRFRTRLEEAIARWHPELICHEQTLLRGGAATEIANGLKAFILATAEQHGIEVTCVHASELKRWSTGDGRADKKAMMDACLRLSGRPPIDDNESDAILIGLWASSIYGAFPAPLWPSKKKAPKRKTVRGTEWLDKI